MLKVLGVIVLSLAISACVSMQGINDGIKARYLGKSAEVPVAELGMPSREVQAAGRKAYVWDIGDACTLQLELDKDGKVAGSRLTGYTESCRGFSR